MARSRITVSTHGTLFSEGKTKQVVEEFLRETKEDVAQQGLHMLHDRFRQTFKHPTGSYSSKVVIDRSKSDAVITDHFVIYGSWLEGTSTRNKSTKFKGYKSFRRIRLQLRKLAPPIAQANLDKALEKLR